MGDLVVPLAAFQRGDAADVCVVVGRGNLRPRNACAGSPRTSYEHRRCER